ncbi:hypothetical protein Tco_1559050, partial [Tanacetum coccineum]
VLKLAISTIGAEHSTAIPEVSTTAANLVYIRRSVEKRKDKGKAIMTEPEPEQSTTKLKLRQERAGLENRPFSKDEVKKNMCTYLKNQGGYKMSYFKGMSYEDIRPIFERLWDQNHAFISKDSEIEKEVMKRPRFDLQQDKSKRQKTRERSVSVEEPKDKEQVEPSQEEIQEMK